MSLLNTNNFSDIKPFVDFAHKGLFDHNRAIDFFHLNCSERFIDCNTYTFFIKLWYEFYDGVYGTELTDHRRWFNYQVHNHWSMLKGMDDVYVYERAISDNNECFSDQESDYEEEDESDDEESEDESEDESEEDESEDEESEDEESEEDWC